MMRFVDENERVKHDYATYLRHAKGQDDKSIDKARAAKRSLGADILQTCCLRKFGEVFIII